MHHVVVERWSRGQSWLHRRDPRAKTAALLLFLVLLATSRTALLPLGAAYLLLLIAMLVWARLPLGGALWRAAIVLPFSLVFGAISLLAGDAARAGALQVRSYLSALAVLWLISTTPMPQLLRGLDTLGAPRFLLMVVQFLYRYLFVISEEAQHMRAAGIARGASMRGLAANGARRRAAAGALAVLFGRSYARAESIHQAMLARGFAGHFLLHSANRFGWADAVFLLAAGGIPAVIRMAVERAAQ